jgi:alpha-glucosidase
VHSSTPWATETLVRTWQSRRAAIPWIISLQQFNLLGSHDTQRIRSIVNNNDALVRLAAIIQFTFPGIPCIYYGDEIGMADDPSLESRGCMIWNEALWDRNLLAFYRDLIRLRKTSPSLKRGGFQVLVVEKDTITYQRESLTERILIVAHRDSAPRGEKSLPVAQGGIADGCRFREYFSGQELTVSEGSLPLPSHPQGATVWIEID